MGHEGNVYAVVDIIMRFSLDNFSFWLLIFGEAELFEQFFLEEEQLKSGNPKTLTLGMETSLPTGRWTPSKNPVYGPPQNSVKVINEHLSCGLSYK